MILIRDTAIWYFAMVAGLPIVMTAVLGFGTDRKDHILNRKGPEGSSEHSGPFIIRFLKF